MRPDDTSQGLGVRSVNRPALCSVCVWWMRMGGGHMHRAQAGEDWGMSPRRSPPYSSHVSNNGCRHTFFFPVFALFLV